MVKAALSVLRGAILTGSVATGTVGAEPFLLKKSCTIATATPVCEQLDPRVGRLVSIELSYSAISTFQLIVTDDVPGTTSYTVFARQQIDFGGGDIGTFELTGSGEIPVSLAYPAQPPTITLGGSYSGTITDPDRLAPFVGTSSRNLIVSAYPNSSKPPIIGKGSFQGLNWIGTKASGTLTLNFVPVLRRPGYKLPPQTLPKPPFTVPPYPKPKKG